MDQENWQGVLGEASAQSLEKTGRGLLLSQVPGVLKAAGIEPTQIAGGRKLLELLREEARECFQLIQNDANSTMWAVLPVGASIEQPTSRYFPSASDPKPSDNIPRFPPKFWHAFHQPLEPGFRRWLTLDQPVSFRDSPEESPDESLEIEREFTRDPTALFTTNEVTYSKIQEWAAKHGTDLRELVYFRSPRSSEDTGGRNAFENFLHHLKPQERARITIPADIVARFLGM